MNTQDSEHYVVLQQAAAWYARLGAEDATELDYRKWEQWLNRREEHRKAWRLVERIGGRFAHFDGTTQRDGAYRALQVSNSPLLSRRQALFAIGTITLAGSLGWRLLESDSTRDALASVLADYSTAVGETREVTLDSGLRLWLNTATALNVEASLSRPTLRLLSGEVLIGGVPRTMPRVTAMTRHGMAIASEAQFSVRILGDNTCVTAYSGEVGIQIKGRSCSIAGGQQVTFNSDRLDPPLPALPSSQAWINGLLIAEDMALGEFISELSRYRHGYLGCSEEVSRLRVVGSFSIKDTDRALSALTSALPVNVHRTMPWWVTVEAKA